MKSMRITTVFAVVLMAVTAAPVALGSGSASAADDGSAGAVPDDAWHGEVMPYFWSLGIDGTAVVRGHSADVNLSSSDLWDYTNFGGSLLGAFSKGHFAGWAQIDYFSFTDSDLGNVPAGSSLDVKATIYTLGAGYQFWASKGKHYDVMLGLRTVSLDNTLHASGSGSYSGTRNATDALVILRPFIPLSAHWAFNPTIDVGGGQSDLTYELWPQIQYQFAAHWAARIGYRRLYYRISNNNGTSWDGSFSGLMLGIGGTW